MKILVNYLGKTNSGPIIAYEMAKGFANCGHDVSVLLSTEVSNKEQWLSFQGFKKVVFIETYNTKIQFAMRSIKMIFGLKRYLLKKFHNEKFDVILNPMHHLWSTFVCNCFSGARVITVCHDPISHEGENGIETHLTKKLMKMSDDIIVLSRKFIPIIKNKYNLDEEHIFYMEHGLLETYRNCAQYNEDPVYKDGNWNFLFFGRIEEYKGVNILIEAFNKLSHDRNDVYLYILGKGDIKYPYESESRIILRNGYIPDEEIAQYFDNDRVIVVLPYISASQSGVVAIAADFMNVVIASDVGGLSEQLMDGKVGIFVKPNDSDSLYKAMSDIINNCTEIERQKKLMKEFRNRLQWSTIVNQLNEELFK